MNLEEAYKLVQSDNPKLLDDEAKEWDDMAKALLEHSGQLKSRIDSVDSGVESESGRAYMDELNLRYQRIEQAAVVAAENAGALTNIAGVVRHNQKSIIDAHHKWTTVDKPKAKAAGVDEETARRPYDEAVAMAIQDNVTIAMGHTSTVKPPDQYKPMTDLGGDSDRSGDSPGGLAPPGGGGPSPNGGSSPDGGSRPNPDNGGHFSAGGTSPQLQQPPAPHLPAPGGPPPGVPAPPPPGGTLPPPPVVPPGTIPPPGTKPPIPPGGTKPTFPPGGVKPTPTPGAKPTMPPMKPGATAPGVKPPMGGAGAKPPAAPRPPQSTVKPVIGSRPGSTGMAPTGGSRPGAGGINRPVIGGRPGAPGMPNAPAAGRNPGARPTPGKTLIGKNGVIGNPQRTLPGVRTPKTHFGGAGTNRSVISGVRQAFKPGTGMPVPAKGGNKRDEQNPAYRPEGGDLQWTVDRTVVPSVISGGDWTDREHTPGNVAKLRAQHREVDESATVERLSQRQGEERESTKADEDYWQLPTGGRGVVVRPRQKRYDANDW